ncbi:MAG: hypothetical protein OQL19_21680 [Gammaproteobacteria bacterium]|nr:hypothetical protein [Gammaproteobacteria bacterium]
MISDIEGVSPGMMPIAQLDTGITQYAVVYDKGIKLFNTFQEANEYYILLATGSIGYNVYLTEIIKHQPKTRGRTHD